jgi:PAS domain S-box-containing protein
MNADHPQSTTPSASSGPSGDETSSLLARFVQGITDIAFMKDREGRYLLINAPGARFLGKPAEAIVGLDDFALFPEDQAQRIVEEDRAVLRSGGSLTFEYDLSVEGRTISLQTIKSVCREPDGTIAGLVGVSRDIGERKALEQALRQRERELADARRIARVGIWHYDCLTGRTLWSEEVYRIYGMDPAQPALQYADFLQHPGLSPSDKRFIAAFERLLQVGEPYILDIEIPGKGDSTRWVLAHGEVERWLDGKVVSVRGTVQEITERKLAEREIALRENRYRSLAHATAQIVWVSNDRGEQQNDVQAWQAFTGQQREQVLGFGWADAIHPDDRDRSVAEWIAALTAGQPFTTEHRVRRHDGVYRDMLVRAVPVRDEAGQVVEWVGTHTDVTDQRAAEREIRIAGERLQDVLDSITDGLCVLDRDWRYTYFNDSGARMLGMRPEQIIGTSLGQTFAQSQQSGLRQAYFRAVETGKAVRLEDYYGAPLNRWFEANCYPSKHGLTVYFRDITERKRVDQALRDSESRFRNLFDSQLLGLCIRDRSGAFSEGNDELLRITGYTREDLDAGLLRWDRITPDEYAERDAAHMDEANRRGSCTPYEKEYIRKDGTRIPILCGYARLDGSEEKYIGFVFDLTRQRQAEADLRDREQRFRLLAEALPELVWVTDAQGSLTYLNNRFLEYCGIPHDQMIGFDWRTLLHPDEKDKVNRAWSHSVRTGEPYLIELRMRSRDGLFRYFLARALAQLNADGGVERWVGSCTDIHDQRLAEEALRRSEKLAATGRLAASIAHEINNPLTSVTNVLYLALQDPTLTPELRKLLETADEELARVSHITTQTLRFHRQSKAAAWADLSEVMQSVLQLFASRFATRQVTIVSECSAGAVLCCFEDELRQVFANLVSNSLDATPSGGRLRVRVRQSAANGAPIVRVTVADTGCGIPPEIRQRIFEPFFSTKDATGIGLGLWVCEGILRKHTGRVRLRSSTRVERHGTVFSLSFPHDGVRQPELSAVSGDGAPIL